ncbi:MAG: hypothetical protein OEW67_12300 [Cyclobacteriaceae bacterium]|nr:hypothetical protein [Cyclobacteriaceae bacterium]
MKIPSIIKIPKHQRFNVEPRYYDPVKEDIEQRTSRIKKELETQKTKTHSSKYDSAISGTFSSKRVYNERKSSIFQVLIIIDLVAGALAYWEWGTMGLYFLLSSMGFLIFLKIRNIL